MLFLNSLNEKKVITQEHLNKFGLEAVWELQQDETGCLAIFFPPFGRAEIKGGIPRFVKSADNYSENFGFQWKKFAKTQLDSYSGITLTSDRFFKDTQWSLADLKGRRVLEIGSGAGRFTEILLSTGALVYSFDYSAAVEANFANHGQHENLLLFQGSVYEIPFPDDFFDFIFCFGVLQHTPDPPMALSCMVKKMKPEGKIAVDNYPAGSSKTTKRPNSNYRKVARRLSFLSPKNLFQFVRFYHQFWFPIDTLIRTKLPPTLYPKVLHHIGIPCFNYVHTIPLSYKQLKEWAILDTFDALGATYDKPVTQEEFRALGEQAQILNFEVALAFNGFVLRGKGKRE